MRRMSILIGLLITAAACVGEAPAFHRVEGQASLDHVEVHGLETGEFNPDLWVNGAFHILPDARHPLLAPGASGLFRNIYAPSAAPLPEGWRLFYGAWDGVDDSHDRIYSVYTGDFLDFSEREIVIDHGAFHHVCNVNAFRREDGGFEMMCTAYPDAGGNNKPAYFTSPDGETWNGEPAPYAPTMDDLIRIDGYEPFEDADINGTNVILREGDALRLYFNNFHDMGQVYRATSTGGDFIFEGAVLETPALVNDVTKFRADGEDWYLMGLHRNTQNLWYAVSNDGLDFGEQHELAQYLDDEDYYIVAHGWVARDNRLLGYLYGAGEVGALNRNRIFARWLQRRVVFETGDGREFEAERALGPDRALIAVPRGEELEGRFQLYAEDGQTPIGQPAPARIHGGQIWRVEAE